MPQTSSAWTVAMDAFLADGQTHDVEEVLAVGAAEVPEERALREMGSKSETMSEERRVKIGKRNVAKQGLDGRARFGKYAWVDGKKKVRLAGDSTSIGEQAERVRVLEEQVTHLMGQVESMQAQLDRLDSASELGVGEKALASVGLSASE